MSTFPVLRKLPRSYLTGIGLVCFEWALLERSLSYITYGLLGIGPKHGRVAVRSPRANEHLAMIRQLMFIEKIQTPEGIDLGALDSTLRQLGNVRDLLAHGVWVRNDDGRIVIQELSGTWKPDPKAPKVSKRISPSGTFVDMRDAHGLADAIRQTTQIVEMFGKALDAQLKASRQKSREQSPEDRRADDPSTGSS